MISEIMQVVSNFKEPLISLLPAILAGILFVYEIPKKWILNEFKPKINNERDKFEGILLFILVIGSIGIIMSKNRDLDIPLLGLIMIVVILVIVGEKPFTSILKIKEDIFYSKKSYKDILLENKKEIEKNKLKESGVFIILVVGIFVDSYMKIEYINFIIFSLINLFLLFIFIVNMSIREVRKKLLNLQKFKFEGNQIKEIYGVDSIEAYLIYERDDYYAIKTDNEYVQEILIKEVRRRNIGLKKGEVR